MRTRLRMIKPDGKHWHEFNEPILEIDCTTYQAEGEAYLRLSITTGTLELGTTLEWDGLDQFTLEPIA